MNKDTLRVIFFGNERLVSGLPETKTPILSGLIENGYNVVAVVSHQGETTSRKAQTLKVAEVAAANNIPVFLPHKPSDIMNELTELHADIAILAAYGKIIPQAVIDLFPLGIINIHPSLLPKYRGSTPIETPIANGDTETGVSIMQLVAQMDAGPVYAQVRTPLDGTETKLSLYERLSDIGSELFFENLPKIIDGSLVATPQDESAATYCQLFTKDDAILNPEKLTAEQAERRVRAFLAYPKTKATIAGHSVVITKAHISSDGSTPLDIQCSDGKFLSVDELIGPSGRLMPAKAFLNGYAAG